MSKEDMQFDVMPGADQREDDQDTLDLSFDEILEASTEEQTEEVEEVEVLAAKEDEETSDETDSDTDTSDATEESTEDTDDEQDVVAEEPVPERKHGKSPMVPKARLDEVLAKQKALQKQLDDVTASNAKSEEAPDAYDFDTKEVEYQNMVLDGETDKAVALRREIRKAERAELEFEMRQEMSQTVNENHAMTALQKAATAMEEAYPVFDNTSEQFNEEYTGEVVELRDAFIMKGYGAVDALSKAVKYVVKDRELDGVAETESSSLLKADELSKKRATVSAKLKAAESQPPELPGESAARAGEHGQKVSDMTEEEFNALPEKTLARLRGDIL